MWNQLSAEQKQNYGEDYFERALRSLEKYTEKVQMQILKQFHEPKQNDFIIYRMLTWDQQFDA